MPPELDALRNETAGTALRSAAKAPINRIVSPGNHERTAM